MEWRVIETKLYTERNVNTERNGTTEHGKGLREIYKSWELRSIPEVRRASELWDMTDRLPLTRATTLVLIKKFT